MDRLLFISVLALYVGCSSISINSKQSIRAAVDTAGNSLADNTALGDIDMAETTVGDFKSVIAPDYSSVSNAAMSAAIAIPGIRNTLENETLMYNDATNMIWTTSLMTAKYYYDMKTQTTYKLVMDNDFVVMQAVTNVPPSADVILHLEGYK